MQLLAAPPTSYFKLFNICRKPNSFLNKLFNMPQFILFFKTASLEKFNMYLIYGSTFQIILELYFKNRCYRKITNHIHQSVSSLQKDRINSLVFLAFLPIKPVPHISLNLTSAFLFLLVLEINTMKIYGVEVNFGENQEIGKETNLRQVITFMLLAFCTCGLKKSTLIAINECFQKAIR